MSKGRVLLVDDDHAVLRAYARLLHHSEFDVTEVQDGNAAIALLKTEEFNVIVSDISMPRLSGLELLAAVRTRDLDVPVILLTGAPNLDSAMRAVEHGAFRYLAKPVDAKELINTVQQATRMHQLALHKRRAVEMLQHDDVQLGDRGTLDARFASALSALWMAYQPIVSTSMKNVFAYEALVRSAEASLPHPGALLSAAERLGRLGDLGNAVQKSVAQTMRTTPDTVMFVNLHVRDLLDERLFENGPLDPYAQRVVLEITERASLHEVPDVQARVARLRQKGFRIAVDDLGAGYAGLSTFTQLEPEVVKLDMLLIRDIDTSATKQKLVGSIATLCGEMGSRVVAEGIETAREAQTVIGLGCDLLQGYHFARPDRPFPKCPGFDVA